MSPNFKDFSKNVLSIILEKTWCQNVDLEGTYISPFKLDFEQLKDIVTVNWRNPY